MARKKRKSLKTKPQSFPLDRFSQSDLRSWQKFSENETEYHVRLFHHLEGLRQIHSNELGTALLDSNIVKVNKTDWVRIVDWQYSNEPLSPKGSLIHGGRFNIGSDINPAVYPPFPTLYVAENHATAYAECFSEAESSGKTEFASHELALRQPASFSSVRMSAQLATVYDLTNANNLRPFAEIISKFDMPADLKALGKSIGSEPPWLISKPIQLQANLMATNWRFYPEQFEIPANTQIFGRILRDAGFDGILYKSTKGLGANLAIFAENLEENESYCELRDKPPSNVHHSKIDSTNWKVLSHI